MADVAYISRVEVEPVEGKPSGPISPDAEEPHPSTLDYLVAAAGG